MHRSAAPQPSDPGKPATSEFGNAAAVLHGINDLRYQEAPPLPSSIAAGEVRIAIKAVGICRTDIHYLQKVNGGLPTTSSREVAVRRNDCCYPPRSSSAVCLSRPSGNALVNDDERRVSTKLNSVHLLQGHFGHFVVNQPMVIGHESAGTVVETGQGVTNLQVRRDWGMASSTATGLGLSRLIRECFTLVECSMCKRLTYALAMQHHQDGSSLCVVFPHIARWATLWRLSPACHAPATTSPGRGGTTWTRTSRCLRRRPTMAPGLRYCYCSPTLVVFRTNCETWTPRSSHARAGRMVWKPKLLTFVKVLMLLRFLQRSLWTTRPASATGCRRG